jgi:hypothetical protein
MAPSGAVASAPRLLYEGNYVLTTPALVFDVSPGGGGSSCSGPASPSLPRRRSSRSSTGLSIDASRVVQAMRDVRNAHPFRATDPRSTRPRPRRCCSSWRGSLDRCGARSSAGEAARVTAGQLFQFDRYRVRGLIRLVLLDVDTRSAHAHFVGVHLRLIGQVQDDTPRDARGSGSSRVDRNGRAARARIRSPATR